MKEKSTRAYKLYFSRAAPKRISDVRIKNMVSGDAIFEKSIFCVVCIHLSAMLSLSFFLLAL